MSKHTKSLLQIAEEMTTECDRVFSEEEIATIKSDILDMTTKYSTSVIVSAAICVGIMGGALNRYAREHAKSNSMQKGETPKEK